MNKIFNKLLIGVLFLLGIILTPTFKVEAGVVTVTANYSSSPITVKSGDLVTIRWQADWATSCENNFNSSTAINGSADIYPTLTKTFTVNCNSTVFVCPSYTLDSVCPPSPGLNCSLGYIPLCFSGGGTTCFEIYCAPGGGCNPNDDPFHCEAQTT
jgi:hypothetical protein